MNDMNNAESAHVLRFLSRWALATVLAGIGLIVVYFGGIGVASSDDALGPEFSELLQAVRAPAMHRLAMTFDALGWLMMGGGLLLLALALRNRDTIRAMLIAACGIAALAGVIGGGIRMVGISDLAAQYAVSTPAQQAALLPSARALFEIFGALFVVGDIVVGVGYLLIASSAFVRRSFPRWLTAWLIIAGVLSLLQGATSAVGMFSFPLLLLTVVVGILGLNAALAAAFWAPSPARVAALSPTE